MMIQANEKLWMAQALVSMVSVTALLEIIDLLLRTSKLIIIKLGTLAAAHLVSLEIVYVHVCACACVCPPGFDKPFT